VKGVALAKSLSRELRSGHRSVPPQDFFCINGTARRKPATGPKKRRKTGAVKTHHQDQELFHAHAPVFLKRLRRSASIAAKEGFFCVTLTFTRQETWG
jgi:hypothetical protein